MRHHTVCESKSENDILIHKYNSTFDRDIHGIKEKIVTKMEREREKETKLKVGWLFEFYGISTFVGYLMPNLFLYK